LLNTHLTFESVSYNIYPMAPSEGPRRPSFRELQKIVQGRPRGGNRYRLRGTVHDAIPVSDEPEDTPIALSVDVEKIFDEELSLHPELNPDSKRDLADFVRATLHYNDGVLARSYLLPVSEVSSNHFRVRRRKTPRGTGQQAEDAFRALFVLASVLKRSTNGEEELRIALGNPNNETGVSIDILVRNGEAVRAMGLVLKRLRQQVQDQSGDHQDLPFNPDYDL
jgi:hypothetical protein